MTNRIHEWMTATAWFAAGIFATGAFWYFLSKDNYYCAVGSGLAATFFVGLAIYLHRCSDRSIVYASQRDQLGRHLVEARELRSRLKEQPLPIADHNAWVNRVSDYLRKNLGRDFEVRFSDFSGMVFYGDGSEKSRMSRSLDGRSRRLHEFIAGLR